MWCNKYGMIRINWQWRFFVCIYDTRWWDKKKWLKICTNHCFGEPCVLWPGILTFNDFMGAHNHKGEWHAHIYLMGWGNTQQTVLCQCDIAGVHGLRYSASREVYVVGPSMLGVGCCGGLWREMDPPFEMPGAPISGAADTVTKCDQNLVRPMRSWYTYTRSRPKLSASERVFLSAWSFRCLLYDLWTNTVKGPCHGERDHPESGWRVMDADRMIWFLGRGRVRVWEGFSRVFFFYVWSRLSCQSTVLHRMIVWLHTRTRIIKEHIVIRHCLY